MLSDCRFPCGFIPSKWKKIMLIIFTAFSAILCIQEINHYFNRSQKHELLLGNFLAEEKKLSEFFEEYNRKEREKKNIMQRKNKQVILRNTNSMQATTKNAMQETNSKETTDVQDTPFTSKLIVWYLIQNDIDTDKVLSCGPYECMFTADTNKLKEADAVVVDGLLLSQTKNRITPERTSPDQVWVYYSKDPWSAYASQFPYGKWNSIFNWTFTYHKDSTFKVPGGEVIQNRRNYQASVVDTMKKKTKKVLWIVNECHTDSRREDYVNELRKFIDVDIMGDCGDSNCSDDNDHTSCYEEYMFYLSFESTLCKDYVTDNFFKTFDHPVVPIVRGGANYANMYQKDLYINTADFGSPKQLAEHLKYLVQNTTAYVEYLKQRLKFSVMHRRNSHCLLCSYLYHLNKRRRSYPNLAAWMGMCRPPTDLNFQVKT